MFDNPASNLKTRRPQVRCFSTSHIYFLSPQSFDDSLQTMRGSIPWMAPEMIKQTGHGRSADVWSLGATMIEMYTARYPWPPFSNNIAAMYHVATATEVRLGCAVMTWLTYVAINFLFSNDRMAISGSLQWHIPRSTVLFFCYTSP